MTWLGEICNIWCEENIDMKIKLKDYIWCIVFFFNIFFLKLLKYPSAILAAKYTISTPLMIENPVRSPIVPPIADNWSTNLAALSLVILSKVGVLNLILIYLRFGLYSKAREKQIVYTSTERFTFVFCWKLVSLFVIIVFCR